MNTPRLDVVWQASNVVARYLHGVRGALPLAAEQIEMMLTLLATRSGPMARFLDLGCGDGILGAAILETYPQAQGVLADFSEPMLTAGRQKLAQYAEQVRFVQLDYADPAWVSQVEGPFDAIVSGYSIHHQPNERKHSLYAEIFDLLSPDGWFVNIEHVASATPLATMLFDEQIIDGWHAAQRHQGSDKSRTQVAEEFFSGTAERAANILAPVEAQCDWLRQIGYQDVDCYLKIYELAVFAGRHP